MSEGKRYPSWTCQRCGSPVGWIGRVFQALRISPHECLTEDRITQDLTELDRPHPHKGT